MPTTTATLYSRHQSATLARLLWPHLQPILHTTRTRRGPVRRVHDRDVLPVVLEVLLNGTGWPEGDPAAHRQTLQSRYRSWSEHGVWTALVDRLADDQAPELLPLAHALVAADSDRRHGRDHRHDPDQAHAVLSAATTLDHDRRAGRA